MEVTFSEPVSVTGEPCLLINVGTLRRSAAYASGPGSTRLRFNYTVVTGGRDGLGIGAFNFGSGSGLLQLSCSEGGAAGTIRDAAENDADLMLRLLEDDVKHKVGGPDVIADRTPPTITDLAVVSSPVSGDTYRDGETIKVQVTFSEPVVAVRWPRMAIWIAYHRKELTYREGTSTKLDEIENLQIEVRFGAIGYSVDLTLSAVFLKLPGDPGRYAGAVVVCDPRWT